MEIKEGTVAFRHILHNIFTSTISCGPPLGPAEVGQVREVVQNTGYSTSFGIKAPRASILTPL